LPSAKDSEKHHVAFTKEPPQTKQRIDFGRALVNIPKLCCTSPKLNGNNADWLKILEKADKTRYAVCQSPYHQKILTVKSGNQNPHYHPPEHG